MSTEMASKFHFSIDRGGTFTDIFARCPNGEVKLLKLLSVDPNNYKDAPTEGIRRIIRQFSNDDESKSPNEVPIGQIGSIRMGTTVATNALLERKGERIALVITKGLKDLLFIGNQSRPKIFDLEIECPGILYEEVVEASERVILHKENWEPQLPNTRCKGITGEEVEIMVPLDQEALKHELENILKKGISSLAVVLMHSYTFPDHEKIVGKIAREIGFKHVSLSSEIMPMVRAVPRGLTACADAYLTPCIKNYLNNFCSGFEKNLEGVNVLFMQSDGGLTTMDRFCGSRAVLSGPAGGVVGYALTTYNKETNLPVIGFDMGGTSTDVSRYDGEYEHIFESNIAGISLQAPQLDINTVAAGGGSMLFFRSGLFVVGPESASAHPGPVCYRKGGPLTVTDANLCLGRLLPEFFPSIFGPNENEPLDKVASRKAFEALAKEVNHFISTTDNPKALTVEEIAMGFIRVANEAMCRPIRALTQGKGYDTAYHALACFGGAGGQHACAIARSLGMSTVFIHRYAGILSAYGMSLADVVYESQEPCAIVYKEENFREIEERITKLQHTCFEELLQQGFSSERIQTIPYLHLRYEKTDCALMCTATESADNESTSYGDFLATFQKRYKKEFGFTLSERQVIVDDIRVRGIGKDLVQSEEEIEKAQDDIPASKIGTQCYFEETGIVQTPVYILSDLLAGHTIKGPSIIIDKNCTILVEPNCTASITKAGDVKIKIGSGKVKEIGETLDSVQLSIFSHRFMSIAEQMGRVLQRTAISTNIKERLDFSCALFGPDGGLVSNAPHIPVHLGAMQETVQFQIRNLRGDIFPEDVILSNHPIAGGSHLPDLTVITPVFYKSESSPIFFVASRGHHADIGGITPGSMPPHSTSLDQEGATFISFKLVNKGVFQEKDLIEKLNMPATLPDCSGTRNLKDNIADLQAQIAANRKGITLVTELINFYGLNVVQAYMKHIQENAEVAVRDVLKEIGENQSAILKAEDQMDDGTVISLTVNIDKVLGNAVFDFTGTGLEVYGNCNSPRAVVLSAIIYCLRCLVGHDVPLNQGCMAPIQVVLPEGCLLNPSLKAAVVGGNVLTSQRVVDVIFKAFQTCAASQGCMNNITFGNEEMGYYETVAGGAGAGKTWHGRSGIHTHMTNTRITDPEILERRFPILVLEFILAANTGGEGTFRGGDGVSRSLLFRQPLTLSVLTERRVFAPYGMAGGRPGTRGKNWIAYKDGRKVNLGSKASIQVSPGDVFLLQTPGGGGYGPPGSSSPQLEPKSSKNFTPFISKGSLSNYSQTQESA